MSALLTRLFNAAPARPPVPFSAPSHMRLPFMSDRSQETALGGMSAAGTLFAIVTHNAQSVASAHWRLYRTARPGGERVEVERHAALDLWSRPNPFMTQELLCETFQQHAELTGEAWLVVTQEYGIPIELWPVRPDRMAPVPSPERYISGFVYSAPDGQRVPLEVSDVIYMRSPNPTDPYRGLGAVQSILSDLYSEKYAAEWNANFFRNSAEPGGIIQSTRSLSDDEFQEISMRWNAQHQGVGRAHRVAILEGEHLSWEERKYTQRDMEFTAGRAVSREVIREAFGISKTMLGLSEDVNRATAESAEYVYAKYRLLPKLDRIKSALNTKLLPLFGEAARGLEFDYDSVVPKDVAAEDASLNARATAAVALISAGAEPASVLAYVGLSDITYTGRPE